MTDTPVQAAQAVAKDVAVAQAAVVEAHDVSESWLSKHKWPVMLGLFIVAVVAVAVALKL